MLAAAVIVRRYLPGTARAMTTTAAGFADAQAAATQPLATQLLCSKLLARRIKRQALRFCESPAHCGALAQTSSGSSRTARAGWTTTGMRPSTTATGSSAIALAQCVAGLMTFRPSGRSIQPH